MNVCQAEVPLTGKDNWSPSVFCELLSGWLVASLLLIGCSNSVPAPPASKVIQTLKSQDFVKKTTVEGVQILGAWRSSYSSVGVSGSGRKTELESTVTVTGKPDRLREFVRAVAEAIKTAAENQGVTLKSSDFNGEQELFDHPLHLSYELGAAAGRIHITLQKDEDASTQCVNLTIQAEENATPSDQ